MANINQTWRKFVNYTINTAIFGNTFPLPCDIADKYLKIATLSQLRVLICFMRNISDGIKSENISSTIGIPVTEVEDALLFWSQCGILNTEEKSISEKSKKTVTVNVELPTRTDIIKRGLEDERLAFLLREAQLKFGRNLKQNENSLLVALYDDYGMDISIILLLLQYAKNENKCNITFIKNTAMRWINAGVETVTDAEQIIADNAKQNIAWGIVQKTFGIEKRNPSEKELQFSNLWINEWHFETDMLKSAYDICVNSKSKLSMPYISKILENWHKNEIKTPDQISAQKSKPENTTKSNYAGYDLELFEKMLNSDE